MKNWFHPGKEISKIIANTAEKLRLESHFQPDVRPAEPRFGDFQANGVLPYAKRERTNPREIATKLIAALEESGEFDPKIVQYEIAGPGFINFKLSPEFLFSWLTSYKTESDFQSAAKNIYQSQQVVVDYPSPNTAKQMHIGHLRPMVIGEAIQRLVRFCGADVIRDNHIGDWGTNFGNLIMGIKHLNYDLDKPDGDPLEEIERIYKVGTELAKTSPENQEKGRSELVKLQNGDPENTALWNKINAISKNAFNEMYKRLNLSFDEELGESFYRDKVDRIYQELTEQEIAEESDGALVVFHPGHPRFSKDAKRPQPFIIRKKDGASNYASTDLATVLYRCEKFNAARIIYVTDGRQTDHFEQLFLTTKKWFEKTDRTLPQLDHVWFGTILGEDNKAIKTKEGTPIKLKELLDEAIERAFNIVTEKSPKIDEEERRNIARVVGIGAVRYADLMQNRTGDYVFSWPKLLNFDGNSAPYLLMAIARNYAIFRKLGLNPGEGEEAASCFQTETEIALARKLIGFVDALDRTLADLRPHFLCTYMFELAGIYSTFFNADRVIGSEPDVLARRLILCARTLEVLETGLHLLGLETLERM